MSRKGVSLTVLLVLFLCGVWLLSRPGALRPESVNRLQAIGALAPAGGGGSQVAGPGNETPIIFHDPVPGVLFDLADAPAGVYDPDNMYDRWMRGEIDLDENESVVPEGEYLALQAAAYLLPPDDDIQTATQSLTPNGPALSTSFDSLDITDCCVSGASVPPDPELAVGPNHVIAVVNVAFEIYDKTGTSLVGPTTFASFFSSVVGCTSSLFDPNTLYDEEADRFMVAIDTGGTGYCVGVSATSDPTGSWHLYRFVMDGSGNLMDYPHAGIGRDAIYMGGNMYPCFTAGCNFVEARIWAFDKWAMYSGLPAAAVERAFTSGSTPQPSNLHGYIQGTWPAGGPHYIMLDASFNGGDYAVHIWDDPFGANTFGLMGTVNLNTATGVTAGLPVFVPQSGAGGLIRANDWRPQDAEYRNGRIWTVHTIACNPGGGTVNCIRWAEIDPAIPTVIQAGVYASPGDYRFFGDLAVNHCNDMAVGYTRSNAGIFPAVWAAGRESGDTPGTLDPETLLKAGEITYTAFDAAPRRWGDYTGFTSDPNGRDVWYLGQYSKSTGSAFGRWGTYIGSFRFADCAPFGLEPNQQGSTAPGASVTYAFSLTNYLAASDSYSLTISGNTWTTTLLTASPTTVPSQTLSIVSVQVDVPLIPLASDTFTLTATSVVSPPLNQVVTATTTTTTTVSASNVYLPAVLKP